MGLFKKIASFFSGDSGSSDDHVQEVNVRCKRCKEMLSVRIDLRQQLSELDEGGYIIRKTLVGSGRCFERIDVTLHFDERRNLIDRQVSGGEFIDPEPGGEASTA